MVGRSAGVTVLAVAAALTATVAAPSARAEDFFSALFRAFGARPPAQLPFSSTPPMEVPGSRPSGYVGGQPYCVRTCDGRYFPISTPGRLSNAEMCNSFCPASRTEVVYGGTINDAATETGTPYSELPNAFRYRNEIVAGCTCNGKDQVGLAPIRIEDDPTLRSGDIVAGPNGVAVAGRDKRSESVNFSPLKKSAGVRLKHVPVVARE